MPQLPARRPGRGGSRQLGQALAIAEEIDAPIETARAHVGLADAARLKNDPSAEITHLQHAYERYTDRGEPQATTVKHRLDVLAEGLR